MLEEYACICAHAYSYVVDLVQFFLAVASPAAIAPRHLATLATLAALAGLAVLAATLLVIRAKQTRGRVHAAGPRSVGIGGRKRRRLGRGADCVHSTSLFDFMFTRSTESAPLSIPVASPSTRAAAPTRRRTKKTRKCVFKHGCI